MSDLLEAALGEERRAECVKNDLLMGIKPVVVKPSKPEARSIGIYHPGVSGTSWERPQARNVGQRR